MKLATISISSQNPTIVLTDMIAPITYPFPKVVFFQSNIQVSLNIDMSQNCLPSFNGHKTSQF